MRDFALDDRWQPDGQCWRTAAVAAGSCAQVLRDKRKLALAFTNCHLQESQRPLAPQPALMSDATFAIYTEFFTHTEQLCFHLQGEHYQERANEALKQLTGHAHDWLIALEWARAIATWMAGVLVLVLIGKAAEWLEVPQARRWTYVAHAMHVIVHFTTPYLLAILAIVALVARWPVPVAQPVEPVEPAEPVEPPEPPVLRRSKRRAVLRT
tara:strand:- start:97 stop:729 length:633 start_codon:yes stop_codon:yes gene_type:complete